MKQMISFYIDDRLLIIKEIEKIKSIGQSVSLYNDGCLILLCQVFQEIEGKIESLKKSFFDYIDSECHCIDKYSPCQVTETQNATSSATQQFLPASLANQVLTQHHAFSQSSATTSSANQVLTLHHASLKSSTANQVAQHHASPQFSATTSSANQVLTLHQLTRHQLATSQCSSQAPSQSPSVSQSDFSVIGPSLAHALAEENERIEQILRNWQDELCDDSENDEEEFEEINWRKKHFEREEYLQELKKIEATNHLDSFATEHKDLLANLKARAFPQESYSRSFLQINAEILRKAVQSSARDLAQDKIKTYFIRKN